MKNIFLLTGIILFFLTNACTTADDEVSIIGKWKLIEVLNDDGGGGGTFQEVESSKTITFNDGNTFTANGDMCSASLTNEPLSGGTYSTTTITPATCSEVPLNYEIQDGKLIISFNCIEPCKQKYIRLL
ncbi:MAG TPA: hypothetical protein EYG92_03985 [Lutibacter sp.]|nr:hypothetical protein [Lutibacter sp.]